MKAFIFGHTSLGLPIPAYQFGHGQKKVLILAGVHGDETEGVIAAHGLLDRFFQSFPFNLTVTLVPALNLDGVLLKTRCNGRGVDLNRNMSTNDWSPDVTNPRYNPGPSANSEAETVSLIQFLEKEKPHLILSLHSWNPMLNVNGECRDEAQAISRVTGYKIEESIGYPTPGCLGTYAGLEREMPTLTYEIERGQPAQDNLKMHIPALLEALKATETKINF